LPAPIRRPQRPSRLLPVADRRLQRSRRATRRPIPS
jgi:hypothetical protein